VPEGRHCAQRAHSTWAFQAIIDISLILLEHHESGNLSLGMGFNKERGFGGNEPC